MLDLALAIAHHLLVFSLAGLLAAQLVLVQPGMSGRNLARVAFIDRHYGLVAVLVILVGIGRVLFGLKGWEFYVHNAAFWAKMAAFVAVAILSIVPTMRFAAWRREQDKEAPSQAAEADILRVRSFLKAQLAVFALIPIFAAAMARGIGY